MKKALRYGLMVLVLSLALVVTGCWEDPGPEVLGTWSGTVNGTTMTLNFATLEHIGYLVGHMSMYNMQVNYNGQQWVIAIPEDTSAAEARVKQLENGRPREAVTEAPDSDFAFMVTLFNWGNVVYVQAMEDTTNSKPYLYLSGTYDAEANTILMNVQVGTVLYENIEFSKSIAASN